MNEEVLAPIVEGDAPRIRNLELSGALEVAALWIEAEESAVHGADGAVGAFHVGVEKQAFAHEKGTGRIGTEGTDGVVGVMGIETT